MAFSLCRHAAVLLGLACAGSGPASAQWMGYGNDPQHTALSTTGAQPLQQVLWQTPVDYHYGGQLAHYGSPLITGANTVLVPVRNDAFGWQVEARSGSTGNLLWTQTSDYTPPSNGWLVPYSPTLAPIGGSTRLYYAGSGGTVYYRDALDSPGAVAPTQLAFYGIDTYRGNRSLYDDNLRINTPITADRQGNVYFGYQSSVPGLGSGIARIAPGGVATYSAVGLPQMQSAPALSNDGSTLYMALNNGFLAAYDSTTLALKSQVAIAGLNTLSTAAPTIGPDNDVYFGTLAGFGFRGNLLHFSADLQTTKIPGSFGWDTTASIVPASMVPGYVSAAGSTYLLFTKYNSYGFNGGQDKIAILDPNVTQVDPLTGQIDMLEVMTQASPFGAEWCINSAVVDPITGAVYANNEDGSLYRWDLATNTLSQSLVLTGGALQPYTPTVIGPDGTVYAIGAGQLFAVAGVPEPPKALLAVAGALGLWWRCRPRGRARAMSGSAAPPRLCQ